VDVAPAGVRDGDASAGRGRSSRHHGTTLVDVDSAERAGSSTQPVLSDITGGVLWLLHLPWRRAAGDAGQLGRAPSGGAARVEPRPRRRLDRGPSIQVVMLPAFMMSRGLSPAQGEPLPSLGRGSSGAMQRVHGAVGCFLPVFRGEAEASRGVNPTLPGGRRGGGGWFAFWGRGNVQIRAGLKKLEGEKSSIGMQANSTTSLAAQMPDAPARRRLESLLDNADWQIAGCAVRSALDSGAQTLPERLTNCPVKIATQGNRRRCFGSAVASATCEKPGWC